MVYNRAKRFDWMHDPQMSWPVFHEDNYVFFTIIKLREMQMADLIFTKARTVLS